MGDRSPWTACKVKRWLDYKGFGWLKNPDASGADIFIAGRFIQVREGIGARLLPDELVEVRFSPETKGRYKGQLAVNAFRFPQL